MPEVTQTNRREENAVHADRTPSALFRSPWFLALVVTLANVAKPVLVDDTAYVTYARHIAANPGDPYGFEMFWWTVPDSAMTVLVPPVVPYWLAINIALFGEHPALLKLWQFPFTWAFAWAVRDLLRRFARGTESRLLPLLVLSPAVLPTVNLMLDVPALALGLSAVAVFVRGVSTSRQAGKSLVGEGLPPTRLEDSPTSSTRGEVKNEDRREAAALVLTSPLVGEVDAKRRVGGNACRDVETLPTAAGEVKKGNPICFAIAAGVLAALAMQTKYTALLIPPAVLWYGITHRRIGLAVVAVAVAATAFAGWELLLVAKYGQSHFIYHASGQRSLPQPGETPLAAFLREKSDLGPPLIGHLGCLGIGVALVVYAALGVPRRTLAAVALVWVTGFLLIVFLSNRRTGNMVPTFWQSFGALFLLGLAMGAILLQFRFRKRRPIRWNADTAFLVGWVLIEVAGYFALTPFGAARRVIGLTIVGGLLTARLLSRIERIRPQRRPQDWVIGFGIAAGFAVAMLDTFDAFPEKVCSERAARVVADCPPGSTVWSVGHWGFQFYCERAGMKLLVPGGSILMPGDFLVLPVYPNEDDFFRPHAGSVSINPPDDVADPIAEVLWDDVFSGQTIPNFYGGVNPILGRDHPRLRVVVYRMKRTWAVPGR